MFRNKEGNVVDGGVFIRLFFFRDYIQQYQVVQEAIDYISINLVLIDKTKLKNLDKDFKEINQVIWKVMGNETKIKYNIVDEIKPSASGKYMYIFSRIKDSERN
jgi:phenylacetate-CoA ligase